MTQPETARVERGPITEVKRFALGMADLLERQGFTIAATELRRLHAENEALLEALKEIAADYADRFDLDCPSTNPGIKSTIKQARAAIKAAEENI